jgi:hypothetical protein
MKKILFSILLVLSSIAHAEWIYIAAAENGNTISYDSSRITRNTQEGSVQAWVLTNLSKPDKDDLTGKRYLSSISLMKYNCELAGLTKLNIVSYSKQFGSGSIVFARDYSNPKFVAVVPGTIGEAEFQTFCKN